MNDKPIKSNHIMQFIEIKELAEQLADTPNVVDCKEYDTLKGKNTLADLVKIMEDEAAEEAREFIKEEKTGFSFTEAVKEHVRECKYQLRLARRGLISYDSLTRISMLKEELSRWKTMTEEEWAQMKTEDLLRRTYCHDITVITPDRIIAERGLDCVDIDIAPYKDFILSH